MLNLFALEHLVWHYKHAAIYSMVWIEIFIATMHLHVVDRWLYEHGLGKSCMTLRSIKIHYCIAGNFWGVLNCIIFGVQFQA